MPLKLRFLGPCHICGKPQWDEVHRAEKGTKVNGIDAHNFETKPWEQVKK